MLLTPACSVVLLRAGDMGEGKQENEFGCLYSRCIRQGLMKLKMKEKWDNRTIWYGKTSDVPGEYSDVLSRSTFCLVLPGEWTKPCG